MKIAKFTYKKSSGDTSERAVIVLVEPSKFLAGIDVTSFENTDKLAEVVKKLNALKDSYVQMVNVITSEVGQYKQFTAANISNQTDTYVK